MSPPTSFADLGVPIDLVAVLDRQGISAPFPIQSAAIPDAMSGRDVLGRAPTGSGKTLAFGIPLVAGLDKAKPRHPKALILSPTRELAEQIRRELEPLAKERGRSVLAVYGGVGFGKQVQAFRNGVDLLVACPGRLLDLLEQGEVSLDAVEYVVVDEADRMADMGFLPDVRKLLDQTAAREQTVFFSATLGREVKVLTDAYQQRPVTHEVGETEPDLTLLTHRFIKTEQPNKVGLAAHLVDETGPTIIFCRTRHGVDRVARQMKNAGVKTAAIHGGRSQNQRDTALDMFTRGKVQTLVATDVAARGIHVDGVECVIHFDPPEDDKAYVHRSGRTARAGASGVVVSFLNPNQHKDGRALQKAVGIDVSFEDTPSIDLHAQSKAGAKLKAETPAQSHGGGARSGGRNKGSGGNGGGGQGRRSGGRGKGRSKPSTDGGDARYDGGNGRGESQERNRKGADSRPANSKKSGPKKKHTKKVAASTSQKRRPSKQKAHASKQRNRSNSNHRGSSQGSRSS